MEKDKNKDYYNDAHSTSESVHQPKNLTGGSLKIYQVSERVKFCERALYLACERSEL